MTGAFTIAAIICGICTLILGVMCFFASRVVQEGFQHRRHGWLPGKPSDYGMDAREVEQ